MKKIFKSNIIFFIVGLLIPFCVSIVFAYSYTASDVEFTPDDPNWNVDNCETSLNYLYGRMNPCITRSGYLSTLSHDGATNLLYATDTGNSLNFTLNKGRYILIAFTRTVEYSTNFSITGSSNLKQIGGVINTYYGYDGHYSSNAVTNQYWNIVAGRGISEMKMYMIKTEQSVTLTFTMKNNVISSDSTKYTSAGKVAIYQLDY